MLGVKLLVVMLLGQMPEEQAEFGDLVSRLGAGRYAEREAASRSLEDLGRPALPALRAARGSRDPEIRNRASGLVQKIEGSLLTQATRVRLDFDQAPLTDVVRSLGQQAGFRVALYPENLPQWKHRKVTLRQPEPVPFWKAVDLLCDAAHAPAESGAARHRGPARADLRPDRRRGAGRHAQFRSRPVPGQPAGDPLPARPELRRPQGSARPAASVRRAGPRDRPGWPPPPRPRISPVTSEQFSAQLIVAAEPRLFISQNGALQVTEAVDNRGNSLTRAGGRPRRQPVRRLLRHDQRVGPPAPGPAPSARRPRARPSRSSGASSRCRSPRAAPTRWSCRSTRGAWASGSPTPMSRSPSTPSGRCPTPPRPSSSSR